MEGKKLDLLKGRYTPALAHELLAKLVKNEMQFHRLQNFTSLIRYEGSCEQASLNIHRLNRAQEEINRLVDSARSQNAAVSIEISLSLSLVETDVVKHKAAVCPSL